MMPQQVWGQSDLICTAHGALENWAYPYKSQIWKFWSMGVAIHSELYSYILRPMVKKLAQSNLPFFSYGQKPAKKIDKKGYFWLFLQYRKSDWARSFSRVVYRNS